MSLLALLLPANHLHHKTAEAFRDVRKYSQLDWAIGSLQGIREDLEHGLLSEITSEIEGDISVEHLDRAKELLHGEGTLDSTVVTVAFVAGLSLERRLRRLWQERIATDVVTQPKGLNALIDDLKRGGTITEAKSKQLRPWAALRNHAAHGETDNLSVSDVKLMVEGIKEFLSEYR